MNLLINMLSFIILKGNAALSAFFHIYSMSYFPPNIPYIKLKLLQNAVDLPVH